MMYKQYKRRAQAITECADCAGSLASTQINNTMWTFNAAHFHLSSTCLSLCRTWLCLSSHTFLTLPTGVVEDHLIRARVCVCFITRNPGFRSYHPQPPSAKKCFFAFDSRAVCFFPRLRSYHPQPPCAKNCFSFLDSRAVCFLS